MFKSIKPIKPVKPSEQRLEPEVFTESLKVIREEANEYLNELIDRALNDAYRIGYVDGASDMLFMKDSL